VLRQGENRDSDWQDVQHFVAANAEPGDATLFVPASNAAPFEYYELAGAGGAPNPVLPMGRWGDLEADLFDIDEARAIDRGLEAVQQHDRVWLLSGGFVREEDAQHVEDGLQRFGPPAVDRRFGDVRARLFLDTSS
ncbi:MAG TPA: hypothetical protein VFX21_00705, partial [Acidimicrobiia bacterium]|nr:hypothetical protein [Acidimicrobiia bacterium]